MAPREAHELNVKSSTKPDEDGEIMSRVLETTWQDLQRDINAAFAESSAVSPDHPCARMVCGADWQRLRDELGTLFTAGRSDGLQSLPQAK